MDLKIEGKKALICAASKGLGKATAMCLAEEGAELMLCARDLDSLKSAAEEIRAVTKRPVHFKECDLTNEGSRAELIQAVEKSMGSIDIVVHNTGGPAPTSAEETQLQQWKEGYERLFASVAHLNQAFIPGMKKNRWGRIVAVTSLSVLEPIPGLAVSNAMRSAVTAMLKTLADELAPFNITVNCVAPGLINTDRSKSLLETRLEKSGQSREQFMGDYLKSIPAKRLGEPDEFGSAVAFLCSEQAAYITGSTLSVDGGKRRATY